MDTDDIIGMFLLLGLISTAVYIYEGLEFLHAFLFIYILALIAHG